jgi:hypothetical protein
MPASLALVKDQLANRNSSQIQAKAEKFRAKHVVLCPDLHCFVETSSLSSELPCFVRNFLALGKTHQLKRKLP